MIQFKYGKLGILLLMIFFACKNSTENPIPITEIPNSDFEKWEKVNNFDNPENWHTSNFSLYGVVTFKTVTNDSIENYSGNYCPRLETKSQYIENSTVKVVGLITLGNFDVNIATRKAKVSGGLPFLSKPVGLEGYFKYNGVGKDSCFVDIAITKFNISTLMQDTIGHGKFSSASVANWTSFDIPIKYYLEETPDSMNIVILSSDTSIFEAGSTLWVDKLHLKY